MSSDRADLARGCGGLIVAGVAAIVLWAAAIAAAALIVEAVRP